MDFLIPILLLTPLAQAADVVFSASCTREVSCSNGSAKSESFRVDFSVSFAERSAVTSDAATGQICDDLYGIEETSCKVEKCTSAQTTTASMSCQVSGRILGIKAHFSCHKTCTRVSSRPPGTKPPTVQNGVNGLNGMNGVNGLNGMNGFNDFNGRNFDTNRSP